jgi:glycine oxidase
MAILGRRIRVVGAGIVGLAVADELLRRGHRVEVVDPAPGSGASYAAAGMISPVGELWHGEDRLHALGRSSARLWPAYAERLGVPLSHGSLLVAADAGDLQQVDRQVALAVEHGDEAEMLSRRELLRREPGQGRVAGGAWLPDDHSVDPRAVLAALLTRVPVIEAPTPASSTTPEVTVLATGAALPGRYAGLVRGVRGEIVRLQVERRDLPTRTLRSWVRGEPVYVVPRASGEVVVGATQEEHDAPPVVTAGGLWRLLDAARRVLPALDRARFVEATARDRPGTVDNLPLVGPTEDPGVVLAAGHFRHGVLLAPLTARLVADHLENGDVEPALDPRRFSIRSPRRGAPRGPSGLRGRGRRQRHRRRPQHVGGPSPARGRSAGHRHGGAGWLTGWLTRPSPSRARGSTRGCGSAPAGCRPSGCCPTCSPPPDLAW